MRLPELRVNPFAERIVEVFSHSVEDKLYFEDFLDLMSVFNEKVRRAPPLRKKAAHSFPHLCFCRHRRKSRPRMPFAFMVRERGDTIKSAVGNKEREAEAKREMSALFGCTAGLDLLMPPYGAPCLSFLAFFLDFDDDGFLGREDLTAMVRLITDEKAFSDSEVVDVVNRVRTHFPFLFSPLSLSLLALLLPKGVLYLSCAAHT